LVNKLASLVSTIEFRWAGSVVFGGQFTEYPQLIGERTAGANHFGGIEPIGAGLAAFIPVGRTYDPDTGKDWEGTGIVPDIEVPVDQALDRALALATK
jgi:C-terminal processing protease CtpA/Prc